MPTAIPRDAAERFGHFFKALARDEASQSWCREHGVDYRTRAASEGINSAGGFLVPEDFDKVPVDVMPTTGAFRRAADVRPTTSDYQVRPRVTGRLTAHYVPEGAAIPESQLLLTGIEAKPRRIATLTRVPSELWEDSAVDLGTFLTSEIRWALDAIEDDSAWNGDGTSTYGGVLGLATKLSGLSSAVSAAAGHNTFGSLDEVDLSNLVGAVGTVAQAGASWIVSSSGFAGALSRLSTVAGNIMMLHNDGDGTTTPIFMGWPVLFSSKMADVSTSLTGKIMMAFGNLKMSSVLVERQPTTIALSWHRAFDQDEVLVRASRRNDIIHHTVGDAGDGTARPPIAILVGG